MLCPSIRQLDVQSLRTCFLLLTTLISALCPLLLFIDDIDLASNKRNITEGMQQMLDACDELRSVIGSETQEEKSKCFFEEIEITTRSRDTKEH